MKELVLAAEALKIAFRLLGADDDKLDLAFDLYQSVIHSKNTDLIEQYFHMLPAIRELFADEYDDYNILNLFTKELPYISTQEYRDHIVPFLTASIRVKNKRFIDHIIHFWEEEIYHKSPKDRWFVKEMDELVRLGKSVK